MLCSHLTIGYMEGRRIESKQQRYLWTSCNHQPEIPSQSYPQNSESHVKVKIKKVRYFILVRGHIKHIFQYLHYQGHWVSLLARLQQYIRSHQSKHSTRRAMQPSTKIWLADCRLFAGSGDQLFSTPIACRADELVMVSGIL